MPAFTLQLYWPGLSAILLFVLSLNPRTAWMRVKALVGRIDFTPVPDTMVDGVKLLNDIEVRIDKQIAKHRDAIEKLENYKRNARSMFIGKESVIQ